MTYYTDADGDGHGNPEAGDSGCNQPAGTSTIGDDCDDADPTSHPDAPELCDGLDNDCDGTADEDAAGVSWYTDADADGFGDADTLETGCEAPVGSVASAGDCNDADPAIHPEAEELCNGLDDDCDGEIDNGADTVSVYGDVDGDGYGYDATVREVCQPGEGEATTGGDCNDSESSIHPGAEETDCSDPVDYNCDGAVGYTDGDLDGYAACEECDDSNAAVNPLGFEVCNSIDDDCDTAIDDDDDSLDTATASTWYADLDGDGFGDPSAPLAACDPGAGYVLDATDCDDTRADISPAALEVCNGFDDDCDTLVDDADPSVDASAGGTWYTDSDGDGYGDDSTAVFACDAPVGLASAGGDCDDADGAYHPGADESDCADPNDYNCDGSTGYTDSDGDGYAACEECDDADAGVSPAATEVCDGVDNDCEGTIDGADATGTTTWYSDNDADGFGDASTGADACSAPAGAVADATDCDDSNASVNPAQVELCNGIDDDCDSAVDDSAVDELPYYTDSDGDGYGDERTAASACELPAGAVVVGGDCDDSLAAVNPAATEYCDGIDNDCDGATDESSAADAATWYEDADADGFGDASSTTADCSPPVGYSADSSDCDDGNGGVYPGAVETCDGVDEDCNGVVDDGAVGTTWYADSDLDGYGDSSAFTVSCSAPAGFVGAGTDCDDTVSAVNPGATELCNGFDDDCDGTVDAGAADALTWYSDADGDGFGDSASFVDSCEGPAGTVADSTDCDDADATVNPSATELCDGIDNDCDGTADEGLSSSTWYTDADGDGYGDSAASTAACAAPAGTVADATDCDDGDALVNPAATEVCNGEDDDCDGAVDDGTSAVDWYVDADGDGYGDVGTSTSSCSAPAGYVRSSTDCDDGDSSVNPAASEVCDGVDQDCDGVVDNGVSTSTWYADSDGDGAGDATSGVVACAAPAGAVSTGTDCDDTDAAIYAGATETCDGVDEDCDGVVDDGLAGTVYYADDDADGYGDPAAGVSACSAPAGHVSSATDCDDLDAAVNPAATEVCDAADNDCDGLTDEGLSSTWYADSDADGYGDPGSATAACTDPAGYVVGSSDCDDTDAAINPGATELCNGVDDDCDATVDEGLSGRYYADDDVDGYGDASDSATDCTAPAGYVSDATDCDDATFTTHPGATELCNGVDDDCDGAIDDGATAEVYYADIDGDTFGDAADSTTGCGAPAGYVSDGTDCDDADAAINPAATEVCDTIDNDCDGTVDEGTGSTWYADVDGDTYGDVLDATLACSAPAGYLADATDCDDTDATINPAALEVCDTLDNDCNGVVDDGAVCPCDTDEYDGHVYMFCVTGTAWATARTDCLSYGYDLAAIGDAAEDAWVLDAVQTYIGGKAWLGGNDRTSEGTWEWSNGEAMSYTNWGPREPSSAGPNQDCMKTNHLRSGQWSDHNCTSGFGYVCEE